MKVSLRVNGQPESVEVAPLRRLLDVLRDELHLTGTKEGCGEGECGSCTVLLDGDPVNACLTAIGQCEGRSVTTIEGLGDPGSLTPPPHLKERFEQVVALGNELQSCFVSEGGAQCGICTPGMLLSAEALLAHTPRPTEHQVREALAGNVCRCTGYQRIVESVLVAAERRAGANAK